MSYRILLVDRDVQNAEKRRAPLQGAGYQVEIAAGAAVAIEAFARLQPQLVILDAAEPEEDIRRLCAAIRQRDPRVPLALLTDVGNDPAQVALVLNQYSCDQLIDRSLAAEPMLRLIEKLVRAAPGVPPGVTEPANGATLWLDSEELVSALEKLDTIITHAAAGRVKPGAGPPAPVLAHVDEETNRDVPARTEPAVREDGGADIDAHLDSVFSRGLPEPEATVPRESPAPPTPVPSATGSGDSPAPLGLRSVPKSSAASAAESRGPVVVSEIVRAAAKAAGPLHTPAIERSRTAPATTTRSSESAPTLRWMIAATAIVTLLGAGYLLWFRGGAEVAVQVAQGNPAPPELPPFTPAAADRSGEDDTSALSKASEAPPVSSPAATPAPPVATTAPKPAPTAGPGATQVATAAPPPRASARPAREEPKTRRASPPPKPRPTPAPVATAAPVAAPPPANTEVAPTPPAPAKREEAAPVAIASASPPPSARQASEPVFEPPVPIARVEPSYPKKAVKGLADPRVVLKLLVDDRGRITRVLVDKGLPGSELEAAAVSAVLRWQFRPARRDGAPVEGWATAEFVFGEGN